MNILILGGNRYFGKSVLEELLKEKHKIYLINRNTKKKKFRHNNLIHIISDRKNINNLKPLFKNINFDFVLDNIAYKLNDVKILHKLLKKKIKHYIFTSSVITYLNSNDCYEAKETDWFKGKINNNWIKIKKFKDIDIQYAKNKKKIENYLIKNNTIKYTILRVPNVIGKNDFSNKTQRLLNYPYNEKFETDISGDDLMQFILKEDLVKVITRIIKKNPKNSEIYNVGNKKIKIKEFYKKLKMSKYNRKNKFVEPNNIFPFSLNNLMNCNKVKKKLNIKFTSINKTLRLIT